MPPKRNPGLFAALNGRNNSKINKSVINASLQAQANQAQANNDLLKKFMLSECETYNVAKVQEDITKIKTDLSQNTLQNLLHTYNPYKFKMLLMILCYGIECPNHPDINNYDDIKTLLKYYEPLELYIKNLPNKDENTLFTFIMNYLYQVINSATPLKI